MIYCPYLRGKQSELLAIKSLSARLGESERVIPVIEPVKWNSTLTSTLLQIDEAGGEFIFILNPEVGNFRTEEGVAVLRQNSVNEFAEYGSFIPALIVSSQFRMEDLAAFDAYPERERVLIFRQEPNNAAVAACLFTGDVQERVRYNLFYSGNFPAHRFDHLPPQKRIDLADYFHRQARNADYTPDEFYSDRHCQGGAGYSDFSIVGNHFHEGGGQAHAVAVHYTYFMGGGAGVPFRIAHFTSDSNDTPVDQAGKVMEALQKLEERLPSLGEFNHTEATNEFLNYFHEAHNPGLAVLKRLSIKHHLELVLSMP